MTDTNKSLNGLFPGNVQNVKRLSHKDFLAVHANCRLMHPRDWEIDWATLPKTLERDGSGEPVYFKTGRTEAPQRIVTYDKGKLRACLDRSGYWEFYSRGSEGQLLRYENSYGCFVNYYWDESQPVFPVEKHEPGKRWVLVYSNPSNSLYWCVKTGEFDFNDEICDVTIIRYALQKVDQESHRATLLKVLEAIESLPSTALGRWWWRRHHRVPNIPKY